MPPLPFRALWTVDPWGVLCFDLTAGFRLWRATDWLRHRGGMRAHYADLAATRTIVVDHLEFRPNARPGLDHDELGRVIARVSLAMAFGIAASAPVDDRYLRRCFTRDEAARIMDALGALAGELRREPLPPSEATADVNAAIIARTSDAIAIR